MLSGFASSAAEIPSLAAAPRAVGAVVAARVLWSTAGGAAAGAAHSPVSPPSPP